MRFNAWHYAETDLWASVVAELFAQLSTPPNGNGNRGEEQRRQSRLAAELIAERGLRERLQAARARRDQLQEALREPAGPWDSLPEEQQAQLRAIAGSKAEEVYREAARTVAALRETGRQSWRLIRGVPLATISRYVGIIVVLIAVAVGILSGLPALWRWITALPGITTLLVAVGLMRRFKNAAQARASAAWERAKQLGQQQLQRLETAADVASAEVTALERQVQDLTAAGQLAGLVAERVAGADYRSRLGVMTQIREDFQQMASLLARAAYEPAADQAAGTSQAVPDSENDWMENRSRNGADTDAVGDELPRIDRIILYIDDLDRCPPRRVVEVLEAIHLLLAIDLFVVVVAVDPRWILRAISAHYQELLEATPPSTAGATSEAVDPGDEELWRSTPAHYLEKIFQVVLTLPPLDTDGYQRLLEVVPYEV